MCLAVHTSGAAPGPPSCSCVADAVSHPRCVTALGGPSSPCHVAFTPSWSPRPPTGLGLVRPHPRLFSDVQQSLGSETLPGPCLGSPAMPHPRRPARAVRWPRAGLGQAVVAHEAGGDCSACSDQCPGRPSALPHPHCRGLLSRWGAHRAGGVAALLPPPASQFPASTWSSSLFFCPLKPPF